MILSPITGDSARARRSDPLTSHEAADRVSAAAREASEREVVAILAAADEPITSESIIRRHAHRVWGGQAPREWPDSRIRTALAQLHEKGVVVHDGWRKNKSGYRAMAWRLTTEGDPR